MTEIVGVIDTNAARVEESFIPGLTWAQYNALIARAIGLPIIHMDWPCGHWPDDGSWDAARADWNPDTSVISPEVDCGSWFSEPWPAYLSGPIVHLPVSEDFPTTYQVPIVAVPRFHEDIGALLAMYNKYFEIQGDSRSYRVRLSKADVWGDWFKDVAHALSFAIATNAQDTLFETSASWERFLVNKTT